MSTTPESGAVPRPLTPNAMAELLSSRLRVARFRFDAPLSLKKNEVSVGCFEALIVAVQVCGSRRWRTRAIAKCTPIFWMFR